MILIVPMDEMPRVRVLREKKRLPTKFEGHTFMARIEDEIQESQRRKITGKL